VNGIGAMPELPPLPLLCPGVTGRLFACDVEPILYDWDIAVRPKKEFAAANMCAMALELEWRDENDEKVVLASSGTALWLCPLLPGAQNSTELGSVTDDRQ
jgi:hypothetical protein